MIFQKRVALSGKVAEAVYHHSPDAMLLLRGGVFVECNPAAATLYDRPIKEIIGNNPIALSTPTQDGRPTAECVDERVKIALRDGFSRFDWYVVD